MDLRPRRLSNPAPALWLGLVTWFLAAPVAGQDLVDPRIFGLDISPGLVVRGDGRRVQTTDAAGAAAVGKVHVTVGDQHIVLLPDGQLQVRRADQVQATEAPFVPADSEQIAQRLLAKLPGFRVRSTRHYVFVYNTSEVFAVATSRILESMFSGVMNYAQGQRFAVSDPEVPLVIVMFRNEREFRLYANLPPDIVAYYDVLTNEVVLHEESPLAQVRPELGLGQTLSTIAHEGAHQILHNIGVQQRLSIWPMWVSEGLAEYFAPTSVGQRMQWKGVGQVNDLRMLELEEYIKGHANGAPSGNMVRQTVMAAQLTSTGYASAWSLTHFLAKSQRRAFHDYLEELSKLGPLEGAFTAVPPGLVAANLQSFEKHFTDDLAELERKLIRHLSSLPYRDPFADLPSFVAMLSVQEGRRVYRQAQSFHSQDLAEKWCKQQLEALSPEQRQRAQSAIREFPNRIAADTFIRQWETGS